MAADGTRDRNICARRPHALRRRLGEWDVEGAILAAQEPGGREGLQFLAFTDIEALADVDESRHGRIDRAKSPRNDRAEMGRGNSLRRRIPGMPLILVARVQNKSKVTSRVGAD
jgi:hypothetical protein